jgi:3-oxoadipate enol-lactonase
MGQGVESSVAAYRCADGGRLVYETAGSGEPVVLVHGFGLDRALWDPQWTVLGARYRAIRYDLRGHGDSTLPAGPYTHVGDLGALLAALNARPAHVVGLSMGGNIALGLALEAPAAVRSLTLVDSVLDGYRMGEAWSQRWRAVVAAARGGDLAAAKRLWRAHELFASTRARPEVSAPLEAMLDRYSGWHWSHKDPLGAAVRPVIERLPSVAAPTLVVVGEQDLPDFQGIARRLAADLPRATLAVIAHAGHVPSLEAPDVFNEALLAHLGACGAGR